MECQINVAVCLLFHPAVVLFIKLHRFEEQLIPELFKLEVEANALKMPVEKQKPRLVQFAYPDF